MAKKKSDQPSKADMVRDAIAEGNDQPEEGVAFILKKYNVEISKPMFSSYKSQERARQEKKVGGSTGKRGRAAKAAPAPAAALPPSGSSGPSGLATSVEAIKVLVEQYGFDQVVSIARLFAK